MKKILAVAIAFLAFNVSAQKAEDPAPNPPPSKKETAKKEKALDKA